MSISAEYALEHKNDPAVLCCRAEAGVVLSEHNLEDPAIFDDLVESGLLKLDGAVTIGQAMGATLTKTADSLTPLTPDLLEGMKEVEEEAPAEEAAPVAAAPVAAAPAAVNGGVLKIHIDEGKGIDLELPIGAFAAAGTAGAVVPATVAGAAAPAEEEVEEKVIRTLTRKHFTSAKALRRSA